MCDEAPKMAHHSYKLSDGGVRVWFWEISDGLHMLFTGLHPILCDTMCKEDNFIMNRLHLDGLSFRCSTLNLSKMTLMQAEVVIFIGGESDDIVQVDQAVGEI